MCAVPFLRSGGEQASALSAASREVYAANFALLTSQPSCPTIASLRWSVWWWATFRPVRCSLRQAFALQPLLCCRHSRCTQPFLPSGGGGVGWGGEKRRCAGDGTTSHKNFCFEPRRNDICASDHHLERLNSDKTQPAFSFHRAHLI